MVRLEPKTSTEVRNYSFDWSAFLGEDTIASSTIVVSGVTLDNETHDDTSASFTVSGGTSGTTATITNTITTAGGLTESETYLLAVDDVGEPLSLAEVKKYLRVVSTDEDAKISAMIPRARLWVEDHTGLVIAKRQFVERHVPRFGAIRLFRGPLVSVDSVEYLDSTGATQTYAPLAYPPSTTLYQTTAASWPVLQLNEAFTVTYTAGFDIAEIDDRLLGAMYALIEGEFSEGYAYPQRSTDAAERCCHYLRSMVA